MKLSMVVPAYNEAETVGESVRRIDAHLRDLGIEYEIVLGDDGSVDDTVAEAEATGVERLRVVQRPHRGKGAILTEALQETRGRYVGFIDADLEIDIGYLPKFLDALDGGYDAAIGSKNLKTEFQESRTLRRRFSTAVYNVLVRTLFRSPLSDHQAGFKLFRGDYLRSILPDIRNEGWLWDTEVLVTYLRSGKRIKEIPVRTQHRREGHVSFVRTSWQMFRDMWRLYLAKDGLR